MKNIIYYNINVIYFIYLKVFIWIFKNKIKNTLLFIII